MIFFFRSLTFIFTFSAALFSASACTGNLPLGGGSSGDHAATPAVIENELTETIRLSIALPQTIAPKTPTLSVQTGSEKLPQSVIAQYDEAASTWIADVDVHPGESTEFIVTLSDKVGEQPLTVAQASKVVAIPVDIEQFNLGISSDEYNLSFDADADGQSNLTEITNSTNPFDSSDPDDDLVKVEVSVKFEFPGGTVDSATFIPTAFLDGKELTLSFDDGIDEREQPVSDAEFDKALRKFGALSQAIENKDVDALERLATSSQQSDLFKRLINNNYERIEVSIGDIRLRDIDKTVMGTLNIDSLVHPNGDRSSLSEKYVSRTITSRKVNGDWSKIEW